MFGENLKILEGQWHDSLTTVHARFFRMLSRYQLEAHALQLKNRDEDWLPGARTYVPTAAADIFVQRRYRWNGDLN